MSLSLCLLRGKCQTIEIYALFKGTVGLQFRVGIRRKIYGAGLVVETFTGPEFLFTKTRIKMRKTIYNLTIQRFFFI